MKKRLKKSSTRKVISRSGTLKNKIWISFFWLGTYSTFFFYLQISSRKLLSASFCPFDACLLLQFSFVIRLVSFRPLSLFRLTTSLTYLSGESITIDWVFAAGVIMQTIVHVHFLELVLVRQRPSCHVHVMPRGIVHREDDTVACVGDVASYLRNSPEWQISYLFFIFLIII